MQLERMRLGAACAPPASAAPVPDREPRHRRATIDRDWVCEAIDRLEQEVARSADTHLLKLELPAFPGVRFHFKDEAAHPSGSLKHRLARSLYLYALCNGRLGPGQGVIDASSGSTAISEAWFARLLGLSFTAVMPECTAPGKVREIRALGGDCLLVPAGSDCAGIAARRSLRRLFGHQLRGLS